MALGADRRDILRLMLRQGLVLVVGGVVAGALLAWALTRSMAALLVGVSPTDALTFATATLLLGGIGLLGLLRASAARHESRPDGGATLRVALQARRSHGGPEIRIILRTSNWQPPLEQPRTENE